MASSLSTFNSSIAPPLDNKTNTEASLVAPTQLPGEDYARLVFSVIVMILIIVGNIFVMAAYKQNTRLQTGTYKLLVSLAFCDFLVGAVSVPFWMYVSFSGWDVVTELDAFFVCFDYATALSSALHLTAIAIERWLAISKPFHHQRLSHKHYVLTLLYVWGIACVISGCYFITTFFNQGHVYVPILAFVGFGLPFTVICLVNVSIFRVAKKLIHQVPAVPYPTPQSEDQNFKIKKERKTAITLVIITALFFFQLLPTYVIALIGEFCRECLVKRLSWKEIQRLLDFAKWLQYCNSFMNPCVYAFRDIEMRMTFKRLVKKMVLFRKNRATVGQQSSSNADAVEQATC